MNAGRISSPLELLNSIKNGDRVKIITPHGQMLTGRAVMRGPYGWVLNCGGAHGTARIASDRNIVAVTACKVADAQGGAA